MRTRIDPRYEPRRLQGGGYAIMGEELPPSTLETALLWAFRWAPGPASKEYYFWRIADIWWNSGEKQKLAKHTWSELLIRKACENRYLGIGGAASSGKSHVFAAWALVNWMCAPSETKVLLTSTHLAGARDRIWGSVLQLIDDIPNHPGRIVDSIGLISYFDAAKGKSFSTFGLKLVSADKKQGQRKIGKLIGGKAPRVLLIADELGEISESVQEAFSSNIATNPESQMIGLSNPASKYDPFGVFCLPKGGWDTVDVINDYGWKMQIGGEYVRLDALQSPNFSLSDEEGEGYDYLPSQRTIDEALESLGATPEEAAKSSGFLRMFRAVFNDSDNAETVYSLAEINKAGATRDVKLKQSELIAGLDPSFSSGGDATMLKFLNIGYDASGQYCVRFGEAIRIYEDVTNKIEPRNMQIARRVVEECKKRGLKPHNLAVDATGAGGPFCDILQVAWDTNDFLRVQFGGSASDRPIKNDSSITGKERYFNRAAELFFIGKQFLLGKQLFNISADMVNQMTTRLYSATKGLKGLRLQLESKQDYKKRMTHSPDETDASFVGLELARQRHSFIPLDAVREVEAQDLNDMDKPISLRALNQQQGRPRRSFRDMDASALGHHAHLNE
jgi:hypothetical protein